MFTNAHIERFVYAILATTLVLVSVLPLYTFAQEAESDTTDEVSVVSDEEATTTDEVVVETNTVPAIPQAAVVYKTEQLLGDEVIGDFVVGPGKLDLSVAPGQTRVVEITVSNRTGEERVFEITAEDATGSSDPSRAVVLLGDDRGPYSLKDYISVQYPKFSLPHNTRVRVPVTISIPRDAEPGGLYGSMLVSTLAREAEQQGANTTQPQSAVIARIGSLFFITVPGDIAVEGRLLDFSTVPKKKFYQEGPIMLGILSENTGSIHIAPHGELRITNMFDEEIGFLELEPWFVMPKSQRLREVTWDREFLFGRYTVTALIERGYDGIVDEMSYSFWVLPWKPLAGGFVALFIVLFLLRSLFKNFEFKRKA